jgi:hypothetical protein
MNQNILELAERAEIKFEAHLQHSWIDTAVITPADLKKFAELIIRECADYITDKATIETLLGKMLMEHFGVE